jgi:ferrous iron transport protein B
MPTATLTISSTRITTVALLGNPNTGKTSLFNRLTGLHQKVGNYPGITVEKKQGFFHHEDRRYELIDLPGTYSLSATSIDERIVIDMLSGNLNGIPRPDLVVCVLDATNLQRNLFLASQVADLGLPMVFAVNLWDAAQKQGITIDFKRLKKRFGIPVIPTIATRGTGLSELKRAIEESLSHQHKSVRVRWPEPILGAQKMLSSRLKTDANQDLTDSELRRLLFDTDSSVTNLVNLPREKTEKAIEDARQIIWKSGMNPLAAEALIQYRHLGDQLEGIISNKGDIRPQSSESIDRLLLHRGWGLVFFLGMMYVVFQSVYTWAVPLMDLIQMIKGKLQETVSKSLASTPMLESLVSDGIIEGVGAFLIFLPQILVLFFFIALLESTGYMARAAFLMDKLFHWCGLNGKSFVPMLSSYACAVPGIMAARTIEEPKSRLATILVAPLMSCSARLPIYVLLIGAFVEPRYGPWWAGFTLFAMHFVGLAIAIPLVWLFTKYLIKTKPHPFVLEMPPYRVPNVRDLFWKMWESAREFVIRAGTVIFAITILIWALLYFPRPAGVATETRTVFVAEKSQELQQTPEAIKSILDDPESELSRDLEKQTARNYINQSLMGRTGRFIQPIFAPAGFDWKITVGILASFPAREVIIPTLGVIYSLGNEIDEESSDLRSSMAGEEWKEGPLAGRKVFTLPVVMAIMVFFALCSQCGSTLAIISKETNWKWALFCFTYMTALAWLCAVTIFQVGMLISG